MNEKLRRELLAMAARDQHARGALVRNLRNRWTLAICDSADRKNTARLKQIVAAHGWPGWAVAGVDGANAAWLLVQHADHDVAFQKECLALLEQAVKDGQADPSDWAYLVDRVAVAEQRKQTYGTQFDERRQPRPIEDEANVDARRHSVGLGTLADYRRQMWEHYGPPE